MLLAVIKIDINYSEKNECNNVSNTGKNWISSIIDF